MRGAVGEMGAEKEGRAFLRVSVHDVGVGEGGEGVEGVVEFGRRWEGRRTRGEEEIEEEEGEARIDLVKDERES